MINLNTVIKAFQSSTHLDASLLESLFQKLLTLSDVQKAAILALIASKLDKDNVLKSALKWLLSYSKPIKISHPVLDIVGTGGDGLKTFNISTAASIVVASLGVHVAKHGGKAVLSQSGSSDVIEQLQIPRFENEADITQSLKDHHFAFLWAPLFNPVLKEIAPIRASVGFTTIFNYLGPLINPSRPQYYVLGVNQKSLMRPYCEILQEQGVERAMVVHSFDGLDELSICAPNYIMMVDKQKIEEYVICPQSLGFANSTLGDIQGGTSFENAQLIKAIFAGKITGAKRDIVLLNAAAGLVVTNTVQNFKEGILLAIKALNQGNAFELLTQLSHGV